MLCIVWLLEQVWLLFYPKQITQRQMQNFWPVHLVTQSRRCDRRGPTRNS